MTCALIQWVFQTHDVCIYSMVLSIRSNSMFAPFGLIHWMFPFGLIHWMFPFGLFHWMFPFGFFHWMLLSFVQMATSASSYSVQYANEFYEIYEIYVCTAKFNSQL